MHLPSLLRLPAFLVFGLCAAFAATGPAADDRPVEDASKQGLQTKSSDQLPTLWIIGDSTVKVGTAGQRGWGDEIAPFFDATKINVVNRAIGGRSSRTFITEGRWDGILGEMRAGDIVLMQFGHNDASEINEAPPVTKSTRARGTIKGNGDETVFVEKNILTGQPETVHSYGWYLRKYIADAKDKGAVASIVCSPIPRKSWNKEGKINRASGGYAGFNALAGLSRRDGNRWLGFFVKADSLSGAAFEDSPLVRQRHHWSAGVAVSWVFAQSGRLVSVDE